MADQAPSYRRLPGTGYQYLVPPWALAMLFFVLGIFVLLFRGRRTQLWLGSEHLLLVETEGYREHYKRFNYRDIQALVVRKTPQALTTNVALGTILAILGAIALAVDDSVGRGFLLTLAGFFGLVLLISALRGPSCHCRLRTAVQSIDLVSLKQLRTARKVLAQIRPLIERAQGGASPQTPAAPAGHPTSSVEEAAGPEVRGNPST
jgi:TctA family transporter